MNRLYVGVLSVCLILHCTIKTTISMSTPIATKAITSSQFRVAIIGGGVAGCASARRIAQLAPSAQITLYEIGRGPGGRASTRKTRKLPHLYINHGAPYADIRTRLGKSIISSLGTSATIPFVGKRGSIDSVTGKLSAESRDDKYDTGTDAHYITGSNGEMSGISSSLIHNIPSIETKYGTMIRGLASNDGTWELKDKTDTIVGTSDWLIIAGSGIAHPRWSATFGGEPPLIEAEKYNPDPKLKEALDAIATQQVSPVLTIFFSFSGPIARKWLSLDYSVLDVKGSSVLSRVMVQGGNTDVECSADEEWCSVVVHSTEGFALNNQGVYGKSSSAARVAGVASNASLEDSLIQKMITALTDMPGIPALDNVSEEDYDYGPVLHRWGNAFPKGDPLSEDLAFVPSSCVVFCGDYITAEEKARLGSFESALLSGTNAGEKVANYAIQRSRAPR
mmetsp:Transcript_144/g.200  ORF Transcript_144/g.200 Transcript_144/m.200 type:complete len:450 (+) Transcript_144:2-1351(+)